MKRCTRCNNVIDWEKPFCPLCGGPVTEAPGSVRAEPPAPAVVEKISSPQREPMPLPSVQPNVPSAVPPPPIPSTPEPVMNAVPPAPFVPPMPPSGVISQIHQVPGVPPLPQTPVSVPPPIPSASSPLAGTITQIHQPPSGIHSVPSVPPPSLNVPLPPSAPFNPPAGIELPEDPLASFLKRSSEAAQNINNGSNGDKSAPPHEGFDGNSFGDALMKPGPGLDIPVGFSPLPPASQLPPLSFTPPDDSDVSLPFAAGVFGQDKASNDPALSPNLANIMGINLSSDLDGVNEGGLSAAPPKMPAAPNLIPPPPPNIMSDLPEDKPKNGNSNEDGDFLKMFPGAGG